MNLKERPFKIIKIKFTPSIQEEIDLINKGELVPTVRTVRDKKTGVKRDIITNHRFTFSGGISRFKKLYGGFCSICHAWPLYKVMYDMDGAWLVERFCQECFDKQPIADTYNKQESKTKKK